jgi:hypothetical protein
MTKVEMRIAHLLLSLPVIGVCAMVTLACTSGFITWPVDGWQVVYSLALALPFAFAFFMILQGIHKDRPLRAVVGVCNSILLGTPPTFILFEPMDGEGKLYILALFPLYLWTVVAVMSLIGIASDALTGPRKA